VPNGAPWIHEIKFDGYRVQLHIRNEAIRIFTRRDHDWTHRFRKIGEDAWPISAESAIIDGEVVAPAADGTTDFSVLQNELKGRSKKIVLVAFDPDRRCIGLEDPADHNPVREHVVIIIIPLAGWSVCGGAL
jgi:bifunctional non-homologous end joining protein LigD